MQQFLGLGRVGIAGGDIARAAGSNAIGNLNAVGLFESLDHVQHTVAHAGAQIDDLAAVMICQIVHRSHVTLGQIHHMDVIPHAGAVGGVVIVAENAELLEPPGSDLRDVGHQIVGNAHGILADQPAFMRADGVEVPQQRHGPVRIGKGHVLENLLDHVLGPAVGIGAAHGAHVLPEGNLLAQAVYRGRGAEHDALDAVAAHTLAQCQGSVQIVAVVFQRLGNAFAYGLITRKVNDRVEAFLFENGIHGLFVAHVRFVEGNVLTGDGFQPIQHLGTGIVEVVHDHRLVPCADQLHTGVGADKPSAAGQ